MEVKVSIGRDQLVYNPAGVPVYILTMPNIVRVKGAGKGTKCKMFLDLIYYLEPNTNRLCDYDEKYGYVPLNIEELRIILNLDCQKNTYKRIRTLLSDGILAKVYTMNETAYYMNPRYVMCGDKIDIGVLNLFRERKGYGKMYIGKDVLVTAHNNEDVRALSSKDFKEVMDDYHLSRTKIKAKGYPQEDYDERY